MSSNWKRLQASMGGATAKPKKKKTLLKTREAATPSASPSSAGTSIEDRIIQFSTHNREPLGTVLLREDHLLFETNTHGSLAEFKKKIGNFLAMDCEFVGTGPGGTTSELARVSIVNYYGVVIYDEYVLPTSRVTDFRTKYSGITPQLLKNATTFKDAQARVNDLLKDKSLVGHGIKNDLRVLFLSHPRGKIIDTQILQRFKSDQRIKGKPGLKKLLQLYMGMDIQIGSHDSVEDARSTMFLFRAFKDEFLREKHHR